MKPHRLERYMASDDPEFEAKASDIIGLYLRPPHHAAVFCVDEKTAIQALDRLDPVLPLSPGRAERHGFEYYRHGTLSLYAALNVKSGKVTGKTTARHTSDDFIGFLREVIPHARLDRRFTSSSTTSQLIKHSRSASSSTKIPGYAFTSRPLTPLGSTRSKSGLPKSNGTSSLAASSPLFPTWRGSCAATSTPIQQTQGRSTGNTPTPRGASAVTTSLRQATSGDLKQFTSSVELPCPTSLAERVRDGSAARSYRAGCC